MPELDETGAGEWIGWPRMGGCIFKGLYGTPAKAARTAPIASFVDRHALAITPSATSKVSFRYSSVTASSSSWAVSAAAWDNPG